MRLHLLLHFDAPEMRKLLLYAVQRLRSGLGDVGIGLPVAGQEFLISPVRRHLFNLIIVNARSIVPTIIESTNQSPRAKWRRFTNLVQTSWPLGGEHCRDRGPADVTLVDGAGAPTLG